MSERKRRHWIPIELPDNLQTTIPLQIITMDHIPSLPRSHNDNKELLTVEDLFSGWDCKSQCVTISAVDRRTDEEYTFRRFGANEAILYDREPGYMSDFFKASNKILGHR
ncbi:reverse transcriptase [Phytophthora megakarya]|uniref:Reverse transcriptase n=1 Tax=Phytophthora megakarya TaxID=4795 RepID=A0A225WLQ0_9STRA|nr:reverse transcriptase [Phytophthora megakarya]